MTPARRLLVLAAVPAAALLGACASGGGPAAGNANSPAVIEAQPARLAWQLKTREHVDLWLHAWALVLDDSSEIPIFRAGWRDSTTVLKNQRSVVSALDTARVTLRQGLRRNPVLAQAQFAAQYVNTMAELQQGVAAFFSSNGDPRRAGPYGRFVAVLAQSVTTPGDRAWFRLFVTGMQDEYDRWFRQWWVEQQRQRAPVIAAANAIWMGGLRDRLAPFLKETRQLAGEGVLVLALAGEGRTVATGPQQVSAAVGLPARVEQAEEIVYALVHEQVGVLAGQVVSDNTTPAEKRGGVADRMTATAAVRAGEMLLARTASPALAAGYRRWYLSLAGAAPDTPFDRAFPLPPVVAQALVRQLDLLLGGL